LQQPDLFYKWAEKFSKSKINLDKHKLKLDVVESLLNMECRKMPEKFGLSKITEASVAAAVKCSDKYHVAYAEFLNEKETMLLLGDAVQAMESKKSSLKNLVLLHGQQYFASPLAPRNLTEVWQKHQKERENITNKRQRELGRKRKNKSD